MPGQGSHVDISIMIQIASQVIANWLDDELVHITSFYAFNVLV